MFVRDILVSRRKKIPIPVLNSLIRLNLDDSNHHRNEYPTTSKENLSISEELLGSDEVITRLQAKGMQLENQSLLQQLTVPMNEHQYDAEILQPIQSRILTRSRQEL
mmetsp:Transcript_32103/g.35564  ORF Transcript_32103/g.35564 Transcript_32103/m.35564 type:complete len:107 (-) Transcript_32103:164-484(-)